MELWIVKEEQEGRAKEFDNLNGKVKNGTRKCYQRRRCRYRERFVLGSSALKCLNTYLKDIGRVTSQKSKPGNVSKRSPPLGRPQTPEDIGQLAVYLSTAENVTGQAINVDGGIEFH